MTKLEELKAARDASWAAYEAARAASAAYDAVAYDAAFGAAVDTAFGAAVDTAWGAVVDAGEAYEAELKKIKEENSND
jgi:hypothetical protein